MKVDVTRTGPIAWMARNSVAANLLMAMLIVGGIIFSSSVKQEVFPEVEMDIVSVAVAYPGASPEEVEEGVVLAIEDEIGSVDGIKRVFSTSRESIGTVFAELLIGTSVDRALNDIKSSVDRITSFPQDAERPIISVPTSRQRVLQLVIHGNVDNRSLDLLAEDLRRDLLTDNRVTLVEKAGLPSPEISVEVGEEELRRYNLTLGQISQIVRAASIDLPGGSVKTSSGEVLVRTKERRDYGDEFRDITLIARSDGTRVRLGEIATIIDGYQETDEETYYNGEPSVELQVFRVGDESPIEVSAAVAAMLERRQSSLPETVSVEIVGDESVEYRDRIDMLVRNGRLGAFLVVLILGIFLRPSIAFWVSLGIPISFLGAFFFIPMLDVSINMISLFAFLLVLGIVVDDAVVVGEAIFHRRHTGVSRYEAAVDGAREVLVPVVFAVLTTIIAFAPLLVVPGVTGKFFRNIPLIVIPILVLSLVESMFILPAHLAHVKRREKHHAREGFIRRILGVQERFSDAVERLIQRRVPPFVAAVSRNRYLAMAMATGSLVIALSIVAGGYVKFNFFPAMEGDLVSVTIELPVGSPASRTREVAEYVQRVGVELGREQAALQNESSGTEAIDSVVTGVQMKVGTGSSGRGFNPMGGGSGSHLGVVTTFLLPSEERNIGSQELSQIWRDRVGEIPGVERLAFNFSSGPSAGAKVSVRLSHSDVPTLERAAARVAEGLAGYAGVFDIDDGFKEGKPQLDLELRPEALAQGITERELASQVRGSFYGAEASRQQRGRDELRVYVRRPREERDSVHFIENLMIRTPSGGEIPLRQAATVKQGRAFTEISRQDGQRNVEVTADIDPAITTGTDVRNSLMREVMPDVLASTPGLAVSFSGEQEAQVESMAAMGKGMMVAILAMYGLMAVAFRSYSQPIVVLVAIPFGLVGAILGHLLLGYDMSFLSVFGFVALSGVVVNDSLVLIAAINDLRARGVPVREAVIRGVTRRVRPVVLTSLTTFFGLAPIILEKSLQARFLVPMAISLGFGVLFVTVIAFCLVPSTYLILGDIGRFFRRLFGREVSEEQQGLERPPAPA